MSKKKRKEVEQENALLKEENASLKVDLARRIDQIKTLEYLRDSVTKESQTPIKTTSVYTQKVGYLLDSLTPLQTARDRQKKRKENWNLEKQKFWNGLNDLFSELIQDGKRPKEARRFIQKTIQNEIGHKYRIDYLKKKLKK